MFANHAVNKQVAASQNSTPKLPGSQYERIAAFTPALLIVAGFSARLFSAYSKFLNADEAMHYLLSMQSSLSDTYRATLGTAHPPLLIISLHYWAMISSNELFLRLPSVVAGTAAGYFLYAWVREITDRSTATITLALFLFSPALIYTSAEVRQYALLLCFLSAALYGLDLALIQNSAAWMAGSALALYLALLTHYSAFIFAVTFAAYGFLRILSARPKPMVLAVWIAGQVGCAALAICLWKTHISIIRHRSLTQDVAESYLRGSLFHPGQENALVFLGRANIRVFHFLFSQGAISVLGLILFVAGVVLVLSGELKNENGRPKSYELGVILLLPFVINCVAALAGVYPYGGTRHDSYLAVFAIPAIAIAVAHCKPKWKWTMPLAIAVALAICNFTVLPAGAYIRPKNQKKQLMVEAVQYLHTAAPAGSVLLTDYESGLLLSYYVCHRDITHPSEPRGEFYYSHCGDYASASLLPRLWVFRANTFPEHAAELANTLPVGRQVWLFQAGFIVDREPEFQAVLGQYGCASPRKFGANILVCRVDLSGKQKR